MSVAINNISDLQNHLQNVAGGNYMGSEVFWSLSDAKISREKLEEVWGAAGLDKKFLPERQTAESAMRQAVADAKIGLEGCMIAQFRDDKAALTYGVVAKDSNAQTGDKFGVVQARIHLDMVTGAVTCDVPANAVAQKIIELQKEYLNTHPTRHLMSSIVKTLKSVNAISLRDRGGVYFVLAQYANVLNGLKAAIGNCGKSKLYLMDIPATANNREAAQDAAEGTIEAELDRLGGEIKKFLEDTPRPSTLRNRLEEFEALRAQARMYREVLGVALSDVDGAITEMERNVNGMLDKIEAERAAKKAAA